MITLIWSIAFIGGIVFGTQMPWYYEVIGIGVGWLITAVGPWQEMEILLPMVATGCFAVGCLVGDISWAVQMGYMPGFGELINSIVSLFQAS